MSTAKKVFLTTALLGAGTMAMANDLNGIQIQEKGVTLAVTGTATMEVANDEARMLWSTQSQAKTLKEATAQVIQTMNAGVKTLKEMNAGFELQTQGTNSYPVYGETKGNQTPMIVAWRVSQSVSVKTDNVENVSKAIEKMNGAMELDHLSFCVSAKARAAYDQKLVQMAITDATKRATWVATSLGSDAGKVEMQNLRFQGASSPRPEYTVMRAALGKANDAAIPAPSIEAGKSTLNLTVTADVLIKR